MNETTESERESLKSYVGLILNLGIENARTGIRKRVPQLYVCQGRVWLFME